MTDDTTTDAGESTTTDVEQQREQGKSFTQSEVDAIIRDRLKQQERTKFGDYNDLKTKAEGAKTLEERLGSLEQELTSTKAAALRTSIAARFGISTEGTDESPSDADLFLTGTDESTLTAQAQRLAARQADSKKQGNVARKEGAVTSSGTSTDAEMRAFTRDFFGSGD